MKKSFYFFQKGEHQYTIDVIDGEETALILKYSANELWANPNGVIMTAIDNGNGLLLGKHVNNKRKLHKLDYDTAEEIGLLLRFAGLYSSGELQGEFAFTIFESTGVKV